MAEANEIAEAVLIIIKRIAKWVLIGFIGLVVLVAAGVGIYFGYNYVTYELPKSKVQVTVELNKEFCSNTEYPVSVTIINHSKKTILSSRIYAKAHRKGRSTNLADYYHNLGNDYIIEPEGGYRNCWRPKLGYSAPDNTKHEDLIWELDRFDVTFK